MLASQPPWRPPPFWTSPKLCNQSTVRPKTGNKHFGAYRQGAKAGGGSSYDWKLNIVSGFCQSCREGGAKIFQIFNRLLFIRLIRSLLSFALWIFCSLTAQQGFRLRDPLSIYYESWWCGNTSHHLISYVIWSTYILALGNKCCSL